MYVFPVRALCGGSCLHCQLHYLYIIFCHIGYSVTMADWLVRVWIQFMTIHHLWQVHAVIHFKQWGVMLMMHGRRGYIVYTLVGVHIDNQFYSFKPLWGGGVGWGKRCFQEQLRVAVPEISVLYALWFSLSTPTLLRITGKEEGVIETWFWKLFW